MRSRTLRAAAPALCALCLMLAGCAPAGGAGPSAGDAPAVLALPPGIQTAPGCDGMPTAFGNTANALAASFARAQACRDAAAQQVTRDHAAGRLARPEAAAAIIALRAATRHDLALIRGRLPGLAPEERRMMTSLLEEGERASRELGLTAG